MTTVRHWLLTNTFYGNRLPGDARGFVGNVREHRPDDPEGQSRIAHNLSNTECDRNMPGLWRASADLLKCPPIRIARSEAEVLRDQFIETARHRTWELLAVAIMHDHFHIVVRVPGDPSPSKILGDFKSWGTRRLSTKFGEPPSQTWWTERGSKRKKTTPEQIADAIDYVLHRQPSPLIVWPEKVRPSFEYIF